MKKLLALFSMIILSSCANQQKSAIIVGTNAEFPPFEYLEGTEVVGFDIDLIKAIGQELGQEIRIENLTWEGLLPALQSEKVDLIIAGMSVTEDRQRVVDFTDTYFTSPDQMIIVQSNNTTINSMDRLAGMRVGVVLGFTGDTIITGMENVTAERFNSAFNAILALKNSRIDAVLLDNIVAQNYLSNNDDLIGVAGNNTQEEYAIALRKDDELLVKINTALNTLKENGEYDKIYQKYFPEN